MEERASCDERQMETVNDMKKAYDMIASLGGNCSAAMQLRNRGLRYESYPLDWVYMESEKSIRWLCKAFENGFTDFALRENMEEIPKELHSGVAKYSFRDTNTGFCFIHHFNDRIDIDQAAYDRDIAVIRKRIERFLCRIESSKDIFFILTVRFAFDPKTVMDLKATLERLYPGKNFDIHVKEFNAKLSSPLAIAEKWPEEYHFAGGERYCYDSYPYSFEYASKEWEFLDDLEIKGWTVAKPKGWAKVIYKIWKKSSKWLNECGYRVVGIRFGA